jgi:hypothetical protein
VLLSPETRQIFADDEWGDYLIYHLYPTKKVFVDGRSDFYGDKFSESYLDLLNVKVGWEKTLDKFSIDTIVLKPEFALTGTLKISQNWRVAYDDGVAVVFRRAILGTILDQPHQPVSLVSSNEGIIRDRVITKTITRDHKVAEPTTEPTT